MDKEYVHAIPVMLIPPFLTGVGESLETWDFRESLREHSTHRELVVDKQLLLTQTHSV